MARKRMIDPSLWTDEGMAALTPRQQLLYIGLFSNADDEGRLKGSAAAIRLMLPAVYADTAVAEVEADVVAVLGSMRQLVRYEHEGRQYLAFRNYTAWQRIDKPTASVLPPPPSNPPPPPEHSANGRGAFQEPSESTRASRARAEEKGIEEKGIEENVRGGDESRTAPAAAPPKPKLLKPKEPDLTPVFDAFTAVGLPPPKILMGEGKAAQALLKAGYTPEELAACWQDVATGEYGDPFIQGKLSFTWMARANFIGNWQAWKRGERGQPSDGTQGYRGASGAQPGRVPRGSGGRQGESVEERRAAFARVFGDPAV